MSTLEGQVALVTGAARGQGRSHAVALARRGVDLVLVDRCSDSPQMTYPLGTAEDLAETEALVRKEGREAVPVRGDVRDPATLDAAVAVARDRFGRLDIAVANAGVYGGGSVQDADRAVWDEVLAANLTGVFQTLRAVSPFMIEGGYGRIVATASNMGRMGIPGAVPYVASKWGVIGLVKAAALDLAPFGITVNAVAPGNTSTPMVHNPALYRGLRPDLAEPAWEDVAPVLEQFHVMPVPLLDPAEITAAVLFLVGPDTPHVTGTVVDVSAGSASRYTA
ncbi:mycofactocin-coupled SDR family oxidoreductase [Pseudonocardia lutea]|uniref:Mycofactocin-coupled SDR family oxidoreductase n=1 Tax=Pseudonocardia lutea TaxID=2172015 RepID=A0ABW1IAK2_9PSEU